MSKDKQTILALEASAAESSAAIWQDETVVATSWQEPRRGNCMLQKIETLLQETVIRPAEINAIAIGLGPGNYSGLRAVYTTARMLALPHNIPVHGYPSATIIVEQLSAEGCRPEAIAVFGDARRERCWVVTYRLENGRYKETSALTLLSDADLSTIISSNMTAAAPDWEQRSGESKAAFAARLPGLLRRSVMPHAETLAKITARDIFTGNAPEAGAPIYMHPAVFTAPRFPARSSM